MPPMEGLVNRLKRWIVGSADATPPHAATETSQAHGQQSCPDAPMHETHAAVTGNTPSSDDFLLAPLSILDDLPTKDDFRLLIGAVLPAARLYLDRPDLFYPFGAQINLDGTVDHVVGSTGEKNPAADDVVVISLDGFRRAAGSGKIRATALARHHQTTPPNGGSPVPVIQIMLDHLDGASLDLFLPYAEKEEQFVFTNVFVNQSKQRIFQ